MIISLKAKGFYSTRLKQKKIICYYLNSKIKNFFKILNIIKKENPNILQTWLYHADFIGSIVSLFQKKLKVIWTVHYNKPQKINLKILTQFIFWCLRKILNKVPSRIIFASRQSYKYHSSSGYPEKKSVVIQNGVDCKKFQKDIAFRKKIRKKMKIKSRAFLVGYFGRDAPEKNLKNLFDALHIVIRDQKELSLILIGDSFHPKFKYDYVNKIHQDLFPKIHFLGPKTNIEKYYSVIDLFVLPSRMEAFPNVLIESIACGTPCISTDVGDAQHIIKNSGILVESENPIKLATAIRKASIEFTNEKTKWNRRITNARRHAEKNYSMGKHLRQIQKIYKKSE